MEDFYYRSILFDNGDIVQCIAKLFRYQWFQNIELVKICVLEPYRTDKNDTKGSEFGTNIIFKHEPWAFLLSSSFLFNLMPYAIPVSYLVRGRRGCSMRKIFPLRINYPHPSPPPPLLPPRRPPLPQALDILHILTPSTWCLFINSTSPPPPSFNCHVPVYHPTSTKQPINSTKHLSFIFFF